jgi:hypothetical protein
MSAHSRFLHPLHYILRDVPGLPERFVVQRMAIVNRMLQLDGTWSIHTDLDQARLAVPEGYHKIEARDDDPARKRGIVEVWCNDAWIDHVFGYLDTIDPNWITQHLNTYQEPLPVPRRVQPGAK